MRNYNLQKKTFTKQQITGLTNNLQTECWLISVQEMHGRRTAKETDQRHYTGKLKMKIDI